MGIHERRRPPPRGTVTVGSTPDRCDASSEPMGLISPAFALSTTNSTQSWTATQPVTWSLLTRNNLYRVTSAVDSGYVVDVVDATRFTVVAGETAGVFHVRALRNSCLQGTASGRGCVSQATWVVLTDAQYAGLLAVLFFFALAAFVAACQRLKPPAGNMHTWRPGEVPQEGYGTFPTLSERLAAFLDEVGTPDSSSLRRERRGRGRDSL